MVATDLDFSLCRLPPFQHQREDTLEMINHPWFFIASECRTGKTKIVIDAAHFLFNTGAINRVLVVAPAPVRDVWYDPDLGEIAKHSWHTVPGTVTEFHSPIRSWFWGDPRDQRVGPRRLEWYITNYEFIGRSKARLNQLFAVCGARTLLVLDESSFVKNWSAEQTKACLQLRRSCARVVLINGTPLFHSPLDLFSQGNILHPSILDCKFVTHFKSRYGIQTPILTFGGKPMMSKWNKPVLKVEKWTNLPDLQQRFAPYTVRRLQAECLDLPPKLDPVVLSAPLEPETWRMYKGMRDDLVVWMKNNLVARSGSAAIRVMRLSQITSGFLSGIENVDLEYNEGDTFDLPGSFLDGLTLEAGGAEALNQQALHFQKAGPPKAQAIGREKLDVLLWFLGRRLEEDPNLHVVVWCLYRAELFRMMKEVQEKYPQFTTGAIHGGQKHDERIAALALLKPETSPAGPVFVGGIEGTGSFGLDMTAAHTCVTMSSGYSPGRVAQTLDRVYGPGQKHPVAYFNIIATGPKGQRTIDHAIEVARRAGQDVAEWTASAWVKALIDEVPATASSI
jgi:hypothetical protein